MPKAVLYIIEMIVVIAILVGVAAIVFPTMEKSNEQSRQASCVTNLHQLGMRINMYAQDHDGVFPTSFVEIQALDLQCPDRPVIQTLSYSYNQALREPFSRRGAGVSSAHRLTLSEVPYPSTTVEATDGVSPTPSDLASYVAAGPDNCAWQECTPAQRAASSADTRHSGGANYIFVDGHGKWYMPDQVLYAKKRTVNPNDWNDGVTPTFAVRPRP